MRTTVDIPEKLLRQARAFAALRGQTLKDVVNEALELRLSHKNEDASDSASRTTGKRMPKGVSIRQTGRFRMPVILSKTPGKHDITPEMLKQADAGEDEERHASLIGR